MLTSLLAKVSKKFIDALSLGSGFTWPGHIVLKFFPSSLKRNLSRLPKGFVIVSGTNGKTTTSKMISHVLQKKGLKVVTNKSGANLLNGILSALLLDTNILGMPKSDIGVFEVDEFVLPVLLSIKVPRVLLLLNLSRDQLDRYGEVDIIFDRWLRVIKNCSPDFPLVADISQEEFKRLKDFYKGKVIYFNDSTSYLVKTKLTGTYNAKNLNACLVVCNLLGYDVDECVEFLSDFNPAYGRGESVNYKGKLYKILLAKNPASFNNNLVLLNSDVSGYDSALFILNDNVPDGRDISWIYDVAPEMLNKACEGKKIYVSGTRAYDMATRLTYSGAEVFSDSIIPDINLAVKVLSKEKNLKKIAVLPNYSAMLNFRKVVIGRSIL